MTTEVAVVIVGEAFEKRDIVLHKRNDMLLRVSEIHRSYDALQYPLLFCEGEDGYQINLPQYDPITNTALSKSVSAADFYSFRLMTREKQSNRLFYCRDLMNQYLVDMYAKIETERLNFIRNNQTKLRVENYAHLRDALNKGDAKPADLGKTVILPSTFTGSPRYMHERTQDAMTYVRQYGRPDLFITFTCNPKWSEISNNLYPGQKAHHRHDLITRVFHLKLDKMMDVLVKSKIYGPVRCHMYTVEWQKRGLPHAHILLWLEKGITPDKIDSIISAEIPNPDEDPILYEIVKSNMIHGPCGAFNRNSPCMVDGSCSKRYPRQFADQTQTGDDGYPLYRRRSPEKGGYTVKIRGIDVDNRWVVPFSPVLSRLFEAHVNVEICNSVKSIKYICKYINKGSDLASFAIENKFDEVTRYECGRYISSAEAAWRILCFPVHNRYPSVTHLSVHLENGQRVYFNKDSALTKIAVPPSTTLTAFFELCQKDNFAKTLLYCDVPAYFAWDKKNKKFNRRKKGKILKNFPGVKKAHVLGRVYTVHPTNAECYYLRLLLHKVCGPTSFSDLKTVDGQIHTTYQAACKALGLLEDDRHWELTLQEACMTNHPYKIRELFAVMLIFCQISDSQFLWDK
ncbi:unnamed protein product [Bemisia tabaci]|uniref:Helitron helicase-like domain-containing protein n=1 Tax=Bemisia tabaci TaxID=7038 RepID=A0A9P0F6C5_BEMTA|nr:unnamed protein product [Bemisia tabaci]